MNSNSSSSSSKPRPKRDASVSSSSSSSSSSGNSKHPTAPLLPPSAPTPRSKSPLPTTTTTTTTTPPPTPLHITIRFSTSLPDLELDIPSPPTTTVIALKHLIRTHLTPSTGATSNLRFIHNGRILPDPSPLSTVFKSLPPPPPSQSSQSSLPPDPKGKRKDAQVAVVERRVFINCSIGHSLSKEELENEAKAAVEQPAPTPDPATAATPGLASTRTATAQNEGREPRGFDRLAGSLTREEIVNLRLTFRGWHAARYTPDDMPSAERMLELEDAWLDNDGGGGGGGGGGGLRGGQEAGEGGRQQEEEGEGWAGNVDLLVKGMAIGFIFPMGVVGWLLREEGLWSKRMGVFVSLGVLLGVVVGFVREFPGH
ncbi:DUF2407 C-terminal domain-containing protein [Cercophora samala]|uniref:DUF2407 C-terminal domain-containing protein n=1 Tax=Cercophora samala TaxID=330535 RepID=A0AA39ZFD8_9PEZI|nr:DUF2407 C-terminal domain-containing protein [Cercophora samala]